MLSQQVINAFGLSCTYALIALGYNLTFGVLRVVNLAYGEVFMSAALCSLFVATHVSSQPVWVFSAAVLAAIVVGLVVHYAAVRPLGVVSDINAPNHLGVLVSTMGCSFVLQGIAQACVGPYPQPYARFMDAGPLVIAGVRIDHAIALNGVVTLLIMVLLSYCLSSSSIGVRVRAVAENPLLAACSGVSVRSVEAAVVAASSAIAGVAAVLISQVNGVVSPFMGLSFGFKGLVVVIVGGLGNSRGVVAASLLLGFSEVAAVVFLSSSYRDGVAFLILVGALIWRASRTRQKWERVA